MNLYQPCSRNPAVKHCCRA